MRKKTKLILFSAIMAVIIIVARAPVNTPVQSYGTAAIGGAFTLTDQTGKRVTNDDLKGKFALIFMGYANCPDICPATLSVFGDTLKKLGSDAEKIHAVFISVDSKNDSPEKLAEFLKAFDPRIIALTGGDDEIKKLLSEYKAYAKVDMESKLIAHSGFVYLMGKDGKYIRHFESGVTADTLVQSIREAF
jgi:protein SCO1/2